MIYVFGYSFSWAFALLSNAKYGRQMVPFHIRFIKRLWNVNPPDVNGLPVRGHIFE